MRLPSVPRRLVTVVPAILMVLASLGLAPAASAASSDDTSLNFEFEVHENDTVDVTMITKGEDAGSSSSCDADNIKDSLGDDVKVNAKSGNSGNSCTVTIKGMTIKKFNNNMPSAEITHDNKSKSFTFEMYGFGFDSDNQVSVKVTFPGSVSKVSGHGKKSGNTATWNNTQDETSILTAKGADHASSYNTGDADHASSRDSEDNDANSPLPIIIVIVLVLATIGGVATFIIIRQKRAKTGIALGYPQPGQQPYNPQQPYNSQPGYGQPGQAPAPPSRVTTPSPTHSIPTAPSQITISRVNSPAAPADSTEPSPPSRLRPSLWR